MAVSQTTQEQARLRPLEPAPPEVLHNQPDATLPVDAPAAEPPAVDATEEFVSDPAARQLLRWKFTAGDVIRYETLLIENLTVGNEEFRNEKTIRFRWTVFDVNREGGASIAVAFERVRLNFERPPFRCDSDEDYLFRDSGDDAVIQRELLAARAMLRAELRIEATARGDTTLLTGADSVVGAAEFTPGDFPSLPVEPVGPGDSWRIPVPAREAAQLSAGYIDHRFKGEQSVGRTAVVIECRTEMRPMATPAPAIGFARPNSTTAVNRFDPTTGRFRSRTITGAFTVKEGDGEEIRTSYEARQQLLPAPAERASLSQGFPDGIQISEPGRLTGLLEDTSPTGAAGKGKERSAPARRGPVER